MKEKQNPMLRLYVVITVLIIGLLCSACSATADQSQSTMDSVEVSSTEQAEINADVLSIPLSTKYIILSYPAELENDVDVVIEDIEDGQRITFFAEIDGDALEIFCFTLGSGEADGYQLGILKDEDEGDINVYVDVHEYSSGKWEPEEYNRLNSIQERVNDIIVQFYSDERFVAA